MQEIGVSLDETRNIDAGFSSSGDAKVRSKAPLIKELGGSEQPEPEQAKTAESSAKTEPTKTQGSLKEEARQKVVDKPRQSEVAVPELARTSAQFIADFNKLSTHSAEKAFGYLSKIVPSNLKKHVKNNFDATFFENILAAVLPFANELVLFLFFWKYYIKITTAYM